MSSHKVTDENNYKLKYIKKAATKISPGLQKLAKISQS